MAIAALLVVLLALGHGLSPMLQDLLSQWRDPYGSMSHGPLVAALALFFGWRAYRSQPGGLTLDAKWWWLLPLALLVAGAIASELLFLGNLRMAVLPLLVLAALAALFGAQSRRLVIPVFFLYLGLPVWQFLNPLLQTITTVVSTRAVLLSGIPAHVEGNFVHLADGVFQIASGCAGLNYFLAALTLGATFAIINVPDTRNRLLVVSVFAIAGIVSNWLRVVLLIMIGHWTHMQHYLIRVDHLWFGWALFLVVLAPLMLWGRRYAGEEHRRPMPPGANAPASWQAGDLGVACTAALLLAAPAWILPARERAVPPRPVAVEFASGWRPVFVGARVEQDSQDGIDRVVAKYDKPAREARISLPENDLGGEGWRQVSQDLHPASATLPVVESRGYANGRERLIWFWYEVAGTRALTKVGYRWAELLAAIHGRREAAIVAYSVDCRGDCSAARGLLATRLASEITNSGK
jgi:exosortase